jgi:hypothetical protein
MISLFHFLFFELFSFCILCSVHCAVCFCFVFYFLLFAFATCFLHFAFCFLLFVFCFLFFNFIITFFLCSLNISINQHSILLDVKQLITLLPRALHSYQFIDNNLIISYFQESHRFAISFLSNMVICAIDIRKMHQENIVLGEENRMLKRESKINRENVRVGVDFTSKRKMN